MSQPPTFTNVYCDWNGLLACASNAVLTVKNEYDMLDRVTNTVYRNASGAVVGAFAYRYDVLGLVTQKISAAGQASPAVTNSYAYDALGRLASADGVACAYDLAGNRLSAGSRSWTYTRNRLDGVLHDAAGNVTSLVSRAGVTISLYWNTLGQLISVSTNGAFAESYTYDPLGRRVRTTDNSGTVFHAYDGAECEADLDAAGNPLRSYTWGLGIDDLLAVTVYSAGATNSYYAVKDRSGSVQALVNASGSVVESYTYDAWGVTVIKNAGGAVIAASAYGNRYLWQGREYSAATGLYNFRARWYDPSTGRWLSKDPIGISGGLNMYAFCGDDPVNFSDPWGLCEKTPGWLDDLASALNEPLENAARHLRNALGELRNALLGAPELDPYETPYITQGNPSLLSGDDVILLLQLAMTRQVRTNDEITRLAEQLGYTRRIAPQKAPFPTHGQPLYQNGNRYISPDVDAHRGGIWKMFDQRGNRLGTFDGTLNRIGP